MSNLQSANCKVQTKRGFIALISAIIISFLLLTITVWFGFNGFFARFNILDSESKERSAKLAEACGDRAMLKLIANKDYILTLADNNIQVGNDNCSIVLLSSNTTPRTFPITIQIRAIVNKAYTNLKITINSSFEIISWQELSNF